jgi:hypothetical protein
VRTSTRRPVPSAFVTSTVYALRSWSSSPSDAILRPSGDHEYWYAPRNRERSRRRTSPVCPSWTRISAMAQFREAKPHGEGSQPVVANAAPVGDQLIGP